MCLIRRMILIGVLFQAETGGQHVWHQDYGYWCVLVKHEKWFKTICIF